EGGAMFGYDSTPRFRMASTPPSEIRMATTQAKIGRSMKKVGMSVLRYRPFAVAAGAAAEDAAPVGVRCHGLGLAGSPSFTFWMPETTTLSPALRPSLTTQSPPRMSVVVTFLRTTLSSAPTVIT